MTKTILTTLLLLTSLSASAWDDSRKDSNRYTNERNIPRSYTLSGSTVESSGRNREESDRYPSRRSESSSEGTSGAYRSGRQINNSGLIINRE